MLFPGGPEGRFCNYARGVTVAFAYINEVPHLEDNPRRPHRTATELLYKAQLSDMPVVHVRAWRKMEFELRGDLPIRPRRQPQKTSSNCHSLQSAVLEHVCVHVRAWRKMEFELREDLLVM